MLPTSERRDWIQFAPVAHLNCSHWLFDQMLMNMLISGIAKWGGGGGAEEWPRHTCWQNSVRQKKLYFSTLGIQSGFLSVNLPQKMFAPPHCEYPGPAHFLMLITLYINIQQM